jgi:hypothetical protein
VKAALRALVAIPVLAGTVFWTLALYYLVPGPPWVAVAAATAYAVATILVLVFVRPFRLAIAVFGATFVALLVWWNGIQPSASRDWAPDVARMPRGEIQGDLLTLHDVRDFDYRSETDFDPRYEDRRYDLSQITGLDLFLVHWGSPAIAHTIVSWEFANGDRLAISIETRKDKAQEYSAVAGFFKQYGLIYVAADERDVVRLRTNYRGENVLLYRLVTPPARARELLEDYVATMNEMAQTPRFYNAFSDNCTTSIHNHVRRINPTGSPLDWRLLANGYIDEMLYEQGIVNTSLPFTELQARSSVDARAKAADSAADFSARIREGLPERPVRR